MWTTFSTGSADRRGLPREVLPGNRFDLGLEGRYIIGMGMDIKTAQFRGRAPGLWLALALLAATVGCTTRVSFVRVREPLEQQRIRDVRVVAVLPFRNRSREPGASGLFESAVIAGVQDAFTLADRRNVEAITREQEFNASDLVDPKTRQRIQMTGADTAIVGEVHQYRVSEERGTEPVQQTYVVPEVYFQNGKRLVRYVMRTRTVPAAYLRVTAQVGISLQMIRLSDGTTIVSHSANLSDSDQGGGASSRDIARVRSGGQMLNAMSAAAVQGFLSKVVRTRVTERRTLDKYWGEGVTAAENGATSSTPGRTTTSRSASRPPPTTGSPTCRWPSRTIKKPWSWTTRASTPATCKAPRPCWKKSSATPVQAAPEPPRRSSSVGQLKTVEP
jgi:hypothetical protein